MALHTHGSSSPLGITGNIDRVGMHPYFIFKVRRCATHVQLSFQNNKYFDIVFSTPYLGNWWKSLLNIACMEKGWGMAKIVAIWCLVEGLMVRVKLPERQLPRHSNEGGYLAIDGISSIGVILGVKENDKSINWNNDTNSIAKVMSDEPKSPFWYMGMTTGFAKYSNVHANGGSILFGNYLSESYNFKSDYFHWREPVFVSRRFLSTSSGLTSNVLKKLDSLNQRSLKHPNDSIDRNLYDSFILNKDLFRIAYNKLKSKPGMMTPGISPITLDGISEERLEKIINDLRTNVFQFTPGRRIEIPKANGKTRPLTLGDPNDKLVQEVMRIVLEAIYEPLFLDVSHGFRPNRSCHTALRQVFTKFKGCTWWIEGDIKACFDTIPHDKLINCLESKIKDQRFIELIRKALNAGYMIGYTRKTDILGTPQGSIISPILANIYLHQLDEYIANLTNEFNSVNEKKPYNSIYRSAQHQLHKARRDGRDSSTLRKLAINLRMTDKTIKNATTRKIMYIRYADDLIIAVNGSYTETNIILDKVKKFCANELGLVVSEEKTRITNSYTDKISFLGVYIQHSKVTTLSVHGKFKQRNSGFLVLSAPMSKIQSKLAKAGFILSHKGVLTGRDRTSWVVLKPEQIIILANSIIRGYLNYYSFVYNRGKLVSFIFYTIRDVVLRTLAHKYNLITRAQVYKKFGNDLTILDANKRDKDNKPKVLAKMYKPETYKLNLWDFKIRKIDTTIPALYSDNISFSSILGLACIICGSKHKVEMHHIRMMKDLKSIYGSLDYLMAKRKRKQISLCRDCHMKHHKGTLIIPQGIIDKYVTKK